MRIYHFVSLAHASFIREVRQSRKPKPGFHARGLAADLVPLAMPLRAFDDVVRAEPRIKGIGVDHAAGYIHVDVRGAASPILWVCRNGRAVVSTDPFREASRG